MSDARRILIVEDDTPLADMCVEMFRSQGYDADAVSNGREALARMTDGRAYPVVLTDLVMPEMDGIALLRAVKDRFPSTDVLVMTSYGTVDTAVEAMKLGAVDFITKPFKRDVLMMTIERVFQVQDLESEVARLRTEVAEKYSFGNIVGQNHRMQQIYELVSSVADTDATVLIQGETGTGKELVAKAIHYSSHRRDGPFVKVDCAALTETLLESELFGHVKGAYTGATRDREGRFRTADGGTIFLDEIANVPLAIQSKLLRVLQDSEFEPVGGDKTIRVDVRVIVATNAHLERKVDAQEFRRDLYYRLNVVKVDLPPLRERTDDIPLLAGHFVVQCGKKNRREVEGLSRTALSKLMTHDWPGNVRELENTIERAVIFCRGKTVQAEDLALPTDVGPDAELGMEKSLSEAMAAAERHFLVQALEEQEWDKEGAAKRLNISRASLYNKIKRHGIAQIEKARGAAQ